MNRKSSAPYNGKLSKRSLPLRPGWPSHNNLQQWRNETAEREEAGLQLLLAHYGIATDGGKVSAEQVRELALALARKHVPYFRSKKRKAPKWDIHLGARFLHDVQAELRKGKQLRQAVQAADPSPPASRGPNVESLLKRYRDVRARLDKLVSAGPTGELIPLGDMQGRIWKSFLEADDSIAVDEDSQPCPDNPDDIIVWVGDSDSPSKAESRARGTEK